MTAFVPIRIADNSAVSPEQKETSLLARLADARSLIVALSGGADSAYLAWAAQRALGERPLSVTALSPSFSAHDRAAVDEFVRDFRIHHEFVETQEMENPAYRANAADRCFYCKDELFSVLDAMAQQRGFTATAYGVNADDTLDFRPGHRAAKEHRVLAPLLVAALGPPRGRVSRLPRALRHRSYTRAPHVDRTWRSGAARTRLPPIPCAVARQASARRNRARRDGP